MTDNKVLSADLLHLRRFGTAPICRIRTARRETTARLWIDGRTNFSMDQLPFFCVPQFSYLGSPKGAPLYMGDTD